VLWKAPVTHLSIRILSHVMSCPCCSLFIEWILVRLCTSDTGIHKKAGTYLAEQTHYQPPKWASLDKLPSLSSFCWKWEAWHEDSNSMQFYLLDTALKLSFWHLPREIGLSIQEYPGIHRNIQKSIRLHRVLCLLRSYMVLPCLNPKLSCFWISRDLVKHLRARAHNERYTLISVSSALGRGTSPGL
jgi:hypothetical protein